MLGDEPPAGHGPVNDGLPLLVEEVDEAALGAEEAVCLRNE